MQTFRGVTAPLIMPTTLFVLVNALIGAFRFVDHVIVLTKGGPDNATMLLLHDRYRKGAVDGYLGRSIPCWDILGMLPALETMGATTTIDWRHPASPANWTSSAAPRKSSP